MSLHFDAIDLKPTARERRPLHAAAAVSAMLAVLALASALGSRAIYDKVIGSHSMPSLIAIMGGMVIALMADAVLRMLRSQWIETVGEVYDARLSEHLFRRLLRTRMSSMPRAAQAATLFREFETVRDLHSTAVATAFVDAASAVLFVVVLAIMTGPLALVTVAGMSAMAAAWFLQRAVDPGRHHDGHHDCGLHPVRARDAAVLRPGRSGPEGRARSLGGILRPGARRRT